MSMICTLGDQIDSYPHFSEVTLKGPIILAEVRSGGRIPLIIGLGIAPKARVSCGPRSRLQRLQLLRPSQRTQPST